MTLQNSLNKVSDFSIVQGAELSVNTGNTQYIDNAIGKITITDSLNIKYIVNVPAFTKQLNAAWSAGTGSGGLLNGSSFPATTTLHAYIMRRRLDGAIDHGFHTSPSQNTFTDGSSNVWDMQLHMSICTGVSAITPFKQTGTVVQLLTPAADYVGAIGTTASLVTLASLPTGIKLRPILRVALGTQPSSGITYFYFSDPDCTDVTPSASVQDGNSGTFSSGAYSYTETIPVEYIYSNTTAQIRARASLGNSSNCTFTTHGYLHPRGGNPTVAQSVILSNVLRAVFSDANYNVVAGNNIIAQTGTLSTTRTVTLPLANAVPAGSRILVVDESGTASLSAYILISPNGSNTINEYPSTYPSVIVNPNGYVELESDGVSNWNVTGSSSLRLEWAVNGTVSNFPLINNNLKTVRQILVGCGAGGGAGRRGTTTTARGGGGAGASGSLTDIEVSWDVLASLGSTYTLTIGQGGIGAAGTSTDDTNGANGAVGSTNTTIAVGGITVAQAFAGSGGGGGGTTTGGTAGSAVAATSAHYIPGLAAAGGSSAVGGGGGVCGYAAGGSGGGGACSSSNAAFAGGTAGVGSRVMQLTGTGAGGAAIGSNAVNAIVGNAMCITGNGAPGGGAAASGAGGKGGNGIRGSGGSGGGASSNGNVSGGGGNGGDGVIIIMMR